MNWVDVLLRAPSCFLIVEKFSINYLSDSNTEETSRSKIKHIKPIANVGGTTNSGNNSHDASYSHKDYNQTVFTFAAQETDKHKKRRNKGKREISLESFSSDSENSSSLKDSVEKGNSTKSHRFQIISKPESKKWEFHSEIVVISVTSLSVSFQKRCRRESSYVTACPWECHGLQKIGKICKAIMGQSTQVLNQDATMEKFKCYRGSFSRFWKGLGDIINAPDDTVAVPGEDLIK